MRVQHDLPIPETADSAALSSSYSQQMQRDQLELCTTRILEGLEISFISKKIFSRKVSSCQFGACLVI